MTWRGASLYCTCFLLLSVYYLLVERPPDHQAARPAEPTAFLNLSKTPLDAIELRRGTRRVRCRHQDGRWRVEEPAGVAVPSDLIAGLIGNLTELSDVQVVAESPADWTQFGLDTSASELILMPRASGPITLRLGQPNPAGTAVYAQHKTRVYLVGLNVRYYEDLLFEQVQLQRPGW